MKYLLIVLLLSCNNKKDTVAEDFIIQLKNDSIELAREIDRIEAKGKLDYQRSLYQLKK